MTASVPDEGSARLDQLSPEGELEQLAEEMERRDMRTILSPGDDGPVLEVVNPRQSSFGGTPARVHVWHRAGHFWWARVGNVNSADDLPHAAEGVAAALRWSPVDTSAVREAVPDT